MVACGNGFIGTNICYKLYKDNKITIQCIKNTIT